MKINTENRKSILSRLLLLLMAVVLAFSLGLIAACSNDNKDNGNGDEDEDPPKEETEDLSVTNGNFNLLYDTSSGTDYPRTPKNWSYSIDGSGDDKAPSSSSDLLHGVISVDQEKFDAANTGGDDNKKFGTLTNPGTPETAESDTKKNVLMIYNKNATAIRYKSAAITVPKNSYVRLSVWVKTVGIQAGEGGAHINLTGGVEEPVYIKNIVTDPDLATNSGYVQYSFFIVGDELSDKTVYLELGLGYGAANNEREHMKGYAFFDNAELTFMSQKDFITFGDDNANIDSTAGVFASNGNPYDPINLYDAKLHSQRNVAYIFINTSNMLSGNQAFSNFNSGDWTSINNKNYTGETPPTGLDANSQKLTFGDPSVWTGLTDAEKKLFENNPFSQKQFTTLNSSFALMTNKARTSTLLQSSALTLLQNQYYKLSFWVKTTAFDENSGLNVYLTNGKGKNTPATINTPAYKAYGSFTNIDTTDSDKDLTDADVTKEYKWENWQQYTILISVGNYGNETVKLEFYLGNQYIDASSLLNPYYLVQGSAAISPISMMLISKSDYASASTGTNVAKATVSTSGTPTTSVSNGGFSTPIDALGTPDYTNGPLTPSSWTSLPYWHKQAGGSGVQEDMSTLQHGIYNGIYDPSKAFNAQDPNSKFPAGNPTALMMSTTASTAYGYFSEYKTVAANSYYKVSVDVKANTKFAIYLVDSDKKILGSSDYKDKTIDTSIAEKDLTDYDRYEADAKPKMFFEVDATGNSLTDDWITYDFYFQTKNDAKTFRIELWLGYNPYREKTDGSTSESDFKANGSVYFDNIKCVATTETTIKNLKNDREDSFIKDDANRYIIADYTKANPVPPTTDNDDGGGEETPNTTDPAQVWGIVLTAVSTVLLVGALIFVIVVKFVKNPIKKRISKEDKPVSNYDSSIKRHHAKDAKRRDDEDYDETDTDDFDDEDEEDSSKESLAIDNETDEDLDLEEAPKTSLDDDEDDRDDDEE